MILKMPLACGECQKKLDVMKTWRDETQVVLENCRAKFDDLLRSGKTDNVEFWKEMCSQGENIIRQWNSIVEELESCSYGLTPYLQHLVEIPGEKF